MALRRALVLAAFLFVGMSSATVAQDATPVASDAGGAADIELVLVEHADHVTNLDLGDAGPSIGDQIIWGPDPLYDETNTTDTGATTQGICISFDSAGTCLVQETIVFSDGSTLLIQGTQPGQPMTSTRAIVGGTGMYLGARGTVTVAPAADLAVWNKTFEIWLDQ